MISLILFPHASIHLAKCHLSLHLCSMKIREDFRKYVADRGIAEQYALAKCMEEKSKEVVEAKAKVNQPI